MYKRKFLLVTIFSAGIIIGCAGSVETPAGNASANAAVDSDATELTTNLSEKDRGLLAKCGGGFTQVSSAKILAGLRNKSLVGEFRKDSEVLTPILVKDGSLNNATYPEYVDCLVRLDPSLIDKKK